MLATVSSTTLEGTLESLRIYEAMRQREAQLPPLPRLAGVHLEGPYFSQKERGAQDETIIRLPDAAEYERILEQAPCLRRWSIACELPGALELGERLHKRGIMAPPPKGERPNGSFTPWRLTPFGPGTKFAGFETRLCAYSKKSLWCGRSSGRVVPPLAAGRSPTDDFLSS